MPNRPIFIIGFMYAGKTTAAEYCSKLLYRPFLDSDMEIERIENMKIQTIFENKGESYFRNLEQKWINTTSFDDEIISTGGGLPCYKNNLNVLKNSGKVIFLNTPFEEIKTRMSNDHSSSRPLSQSVESLEKLYQNRLACYSKAHYTVRNKEELLQLLQKL